MTKIEPFGAVHERAVAAPWERKIAGRPGHGDRLVGRTPAARLDSIPATTGKTPEGDL
ncbi:hypothetical protein GCM10023084_51040 [Streptomyces lacrimifluminis]|uniref:Uncharacterized protein n=1 Tax=Streptomyces lacrimifluminis TaxID=1500077 RepID=A0A917P3A0_9ACTN|nr:hypothetical protein [Streptomyces lacrimifluminis]GGJ52037.1 hypothetical protein GCM10012282_56310 [Streptomyces lacrimifluminis]